MTKRDHVTTFGYELVHERVAKVLKYVLPSLSPEELANLAHTCRAMATAVRSLTQGRVADAAQGLERWPVPVRNDLDACRYPWFRYTPSCCRILNFPHRWGVKSPEDQEHRDAVMRRCLEDIGIFPFSGILSSVGCRCADNCVLAQQNQGDGEPENECTCGRSSSGLNAYNDESKLQLLKEKVNIVSSECENASKSDSVESIADCEPLVESDDDDNDVNEVGPPLILECGGACSCSAGCCLRVTQQGLSVRVVVMRQRLTGWGLHAAQHISKGSFVCEYAGELLTTVQSRERQSVYDDSISTSKSRCGSALLVVREFLPSGDACVRLNVDATRVGNVARFINHACDGGNLLPCLVRAAGSVIPRLALFARRDINEGEELRYSYGSCGGVFGKVLPCYCGTVACFGTLPSDNT